MEGVLEHGELAQRHFLLTARCGEGLNEKVANMQSDWDVEVDPSEQLYELMRHFIVGGRMDYPRQFHQLHHRRDGIWELKTPDLRLFGWFPKRDCFICSDVANATKVKADGAYAGYCEQAWFARDRLGLDPPKYISGGEPQHVLSN
ncbi:MAG: hypothetical protein VYD90_10945 [Pseudomonadota bacterium]|nr:hypothetical protein [Pseudomonadota bacterium]